MEIKKLVLSNFRGINTQKTIKLNLLNVIVGKNDSGKSTILKALDLFLNEPTFDKSLKNNKSCETIVEIELFFKTNNERVLIDESIKTTLEEEEILNENGLLQLKKTWDTSKAGKVSPEFYFMRKIYDEDDCLLLNEKDLIKLCEKYGIQTGKANSLELNNVEKRQKLKEVFKYEGKGFKYGYEKVPSSGTSRSRTIGKEIKDLLPRFEYFKADTSLSETDTSIQNFFKNLAEKSFEELPETKIVEASVKGKLEEVLQKITNKINDVVDEEERIDARLEFDWSKLIKTYFDSDTTDGNIPLSSRGDGFRRITMMSYFEYLAEQNRSEKQSIIFGFEEPETFLHPLAQENLFDKFLGLCGNGYEVIITTHSPIIVSRTMIEDLSHVVKEKGEFNILQRIDNLNDIAKDIGISVSNQFLTLFDKAKAVIFVEGPDDVVALTHISSKYKKEGKIKESLDDLGIIIIPTGGCGSIKHWVTLNLIEKLNRGFVIFQDSDKKSLDDESKNKVLLEKLGFKEGVDFLITKKRELENYIPCSFLNEICPECGIKYGDYDDVKVVCQKNKKKDLLGGEKVLETHIEKMEFKHLEPSFNDGKNDEFINLFNLVRSKIS
jgi:predicted ATP-dependent endonuclease of OLD family